MKESGLHERLRIAAGERTYRELGSMTGINAESVRRYMQGQAPSVEFLSKLCESLGLNGDWLLTGQGPMLQREIRDHALRDAGTPDLLRATSDTVASLIDRVDRLERFIQTAETRLRVASSASAGDHADTNGDADERAVKAQRTEPKPAGAAGRVGAAVPKRSSPDAH